MTVHILTIKLVLETKKAKANSDGLIKCLRQRQDRFVTNPKIYASKVSSIYKMQWYPDSFIYLDSIIGAVGRRADTLFFARHRDYFVVTRNSMPSIWTWYRLAVSS
jgi:hypothetical protein